MQHYDDCRRRPQCYRHDISWTSAFLWSLKVSTWLLIAYIGAGLLIKGTARVCLDDQVRCAEWAAR